jgi:hypothetical protein
MEHVWRRGETYTGFWRRKLRKTGTLGDPGLDGWIILRWIFRKWDVVVSTESSRLRKGRGG